MEQTNHCLYNFIIPASSDRKLEDYCLKDPDRDWDCFIEGDFCWSLLTYLILRDRGLPVLLSRDFRDRCVNLGFKTCLRSLRARTDAFVVCMQGDNHRHGWANVHIVQNKLQAWRQNTYWIPHWPQPGLIPRDEGRVGVRQICYAGRKANAVSFTSRFHDSLRRMGIDFVCKQETTWNDFSEIDIAIGVRSFDSRRYKTKPATKLYIAWHAGVPFIGGNDSAFQQVGRPGINYLLARTEDELIAHIKHLATDTSLYNTLVRRGQDAAARYTRSAIAEIWEMVLTGPVAGSYRKWVRPGKGKSLFRKVAILKAKAASGAYGRIRSIQRGISHYCA